MPEGDTIHRLAATLLPRLLGQTIVRATTQGLVRELAGKQVTGISAHGKHLVIELDDGGYVRTHLGMYGRVRVYTRADGDAALARVSPGRVSLALVTADHVVLWIGARTVEIASRRSPMRGHAIAALGPDVLADDFDSRQAAARAALHPARTIADVLLDQRVAAGIGNIYKSESLFLCGIDPRTRVEHVREAQLAELYATARDLMVENLGPDARTTRDRLAADRPGDDRFFVYGRTGKPCRQCETPIDAYQLGPEPRWTWSCPRCQG